MTRVDPPGMRSRITEGVNGLLIVIPSKANWPAVIFLLFWLCGWCVGEVTALREVVRGLSEGSPPLFLLVWIAGWTVGGLFAITFVGWTICGEEHIVLAAGTLILSRRILRLNRTREYDLAQIRRLRLAAADPVVPASRRTQANQGLLAFDYGSSTVRFASSIDEAEARFLLDAMTARHAFDVAAT